MSVICNHSLSTQLLFVSFMCVIGFCAFFLLYFFLFLMIHHRLLLLFRMLVFAPIRYGQKLVFLTVLSRSYLHFHYIFAYI